VSDFFFVRKLDEASRARVRKKKKKIGSRLEEKKLIEEFIELIELIDRTESTSRTRPLRLDSSPQSRSRKKTRKNSL
jgi:hypothetical protein